MSKTMSQNITPFQLVFPTPFGEGAIVYEEKPFVLKKVCLPSQIYTDLDHAKKQIIWNSPGIHPNALKISGSIINYFHGRFNKMTWPAPPWEWMELDDFTPLQQFAYKVVAEIPYGQLQPYQWVAKRIGHPGAARFVGTTMARNPYPVLIPCHRVIRSDGTPGQFGGGTDLKWKMITLESGCA
jgi:methylated-DNA-[protein]-cysteine S-methyltransferase